MRRSKGIKFVSTPLDSEEVETTAGACATIYDSGDTDKSQRPGKREDPCQTCPTGYYRVHTCYRSFPSTVNTVVHIFQFFKMIFSFRNCSHFTIWYVNMFKSYSCCKSARKKILLIGKYKQKERREIGLDAVSD